MKEVQIRCKITQDGVRYFPFVLTKIPAWSIFGMKYKEEWERLYLESNSRIRSRCKWGFPSFEDVHEALKSTYGGFGYVIRDWSPDGNES